MAGIVSRLAQGMSNTTGMAAVYQQYADLFGTNKPILCAVYPLCKKCIAWQFWCILQPISQTGCDVIKSSIWWTIGLQFPAIIVGWIIGNTLGALAAYLKKGFDTSLAASQYFCKQFAGIWHGNHFAGYFWRRFKMVPNLGWVWV